MFRTIASPFIPHLQRAITHSAKLLGGSSRTLFHTTASTTPLRREPIPNTHEEITRITYTPWDPHSCVTFSPPPAPKGDEAEGKAANDQTQPQIPTGTQTPTQQDANTPPDQQPPEPTMTTFTPWDPCATRTILRSGLSITAHDVLPQLVGRTSSSALGMPKSVALVAKVVEREKKAGKVLVASAMPWPYRLPRAFWPRRGTTLFAMYGGVEGEGRTGFWQRVFYGVAEPEEGGEGETEVEK